MQEMSRAVRAVRFSNTRDDVTDCVAVDAPLEIRLGEIPLVVTMRTPGDDQELAAGFLFTEGIVRDGGDVVAIEERELSNGSWSPLFTGNGGASVVRVTLRKGARVNLDGVGRSTFASSSCGLCGKISLDQVRIEEEPIEDGFAIGVEVLKSLPDKMRAGQKVFAETGGLHAAGLFDATGSLVCLREDIGRHNAVDKVIGWAVRNGLCPATEHVLMVSGRTSFEIVQKALRARLPVLAAVSAASSLAVETAQAQNQTLIGFLRDGRMTVYCGAERIRRDGRPLP